MKQILFFSTTWCAPCIQFKPIMESLQPEIPIIFIDAEISNTTAQQYNVRSVPTTILVKDGREIGRLVGPKTADEIRNLFKS